ncbi:hypothetical protein C8R44DRAFT_863231 [Mycena epipterygia]|nr:hypothetical protein C8R44DRAFT_863231 [Mycena epipterygia]
MDDDSGHDEARHFFMECHQISKEAQFLVDSLPNVETTAVEHACRQLNAVREILIALNDPHSTPANLEHLIEYVDTLLYPLDAFLSNPPFPPHTHIPRRRTGQRGHPAYDLDLDRAILLHDPGNTWEDIAIAIGVSRSMLYRHMEDGGLSTARKEWSDLTNDEIDELVSEISLAHPFVGTTIVMGHLEAREVHLPRARVQESLRRVDHIGVLVQFGVHLDSPLSNH